jgi:hypothetical protein
VHRWAAALLVAVAAIGAGCDGNQDGSTVASSGTSSSTTTAAPAASVPASPDTSLQGSTTASSAPAVAGPAYLSAVRAARQTGFDRVVFEFEGGPPGYTVGYVPRPVTEDGSGTPVPVEGAAVLEVRMEQAAGARITGETVTLTYRGPRHIRPTGTTTVVEAVSTGDFEGVLTWVIGTRIRAAFTVTTLTGPSRLVVDIAHP